MAVNFGAIDYSVFIGAIVISLSVGIFFAIRDKQKKRTSPDNYFLAGRRSSTWLVTVSYVVTFQSSIMVLANPVEVYTYGMIYSVFGVGLALTCTFASLVIVPVLYPLRITSVYKYFFLRYGDNLVRYLVVITGVVYNMFYMGTVIFGTCVSFEVIIGIPYWTTVLIFTFVTTLYTSIGGIKAVFWTDVFQFIIMTSGILAVLIKSTLDSGGPANVAKLGQERLDANSFSFDPTVRYTIWNVTIGSFSLYLYTFTSQSGIQRVISTKNLRSARLVYILSVPVYALLLILTSYEGVTLFAYHASRGCDVINGGVVKNVNELLPITVTQLFNDIPGIKGLFIASLSSAALSTLSSCLSSLSAIIYEDVIRVRYPDMDDKRATFLAKLTVLVNGLAGMVLTFLIAKLPGSITRIFSCFMGCIDGPTSAIFVLSLLFKRGTSKGVFVGALCGMAISFWLIMGKTMTSLPADPQLPSGPVDKCWQYTNISHIMAATNDTFEELFSYNMTDLPITPRVSYTTTSLPIRTNEVESDDLSAVEKLYTISYIFFSFIGFWVTIIVSVIISFLTKSPGYVEEKYVFSFRKHIMTDLCGHTLKPEVMHKEHDVAFAAEEMKEFLNTG